MIRWGWPVLAIAGCAAPGERAGGIVSTNPCADALAVALAPERLRAISAWSKSPTASSLSGPQAARWSATAGTAEEVIALRPALVLASRYTPAATQDAWARAGLRVMVLDAPASVAASEAQVMAVARMLGAEARGRALVARIEAGLAAARPGGAARPEALLFISGELANGPGTLLDELMTRTGFRNAASRYGLAYSGRVGTEAIALAPPRVILSSGNVPAVAARTRVLRASGARVMEARFASSLVNCGGPTIPAAAARLAAVRRAVFDRLGS